MTTRHPLTVSLTPELADFVATELRTGQYASASEIIRAGLRMLATERGQSAADRGNLREVPRHIGAPAIRAEARRG